MPNTDIAANVRAEMARQGVTQQELAAAIGMTQQALSRRLRGQTRLDVNELTKVARHLDVPVARFVEAPVEAAS